MNKIRFGAEVESITTGFKGVVTGVSRYLTGCDHILIKPAAVVGLQKQPQGVWFDFPVVKFLNDGRADELRGSLFNKINDIDDMSQKLGSRLECKITGITGIAYGCIMYQTGDIQYGLVPHIEEDAKELKDLIWLDEGRVKLVDEGVIKAFEVKKVSKRTGGPFDGNAPGRNY